MADWQEEVSGIIAPAVNRSATIRELTIARNALEQVGPMVRRCFEGDKVVLFADDAGFSATGERVVQAFEGAGLGVTRHVINAHPLPKPTVELGARFSDLLGDEKTVPVALGSGVINDLVKYGAYLKNKPYLAIATAASMDGYASAGAPMIRDGFKITIPTRAPRAILADLDVIASAPGEMTSWGYGDLAGKVPAGGDWILADALDIEPIDDVAWPLVQNNLRGWLAHPGALAAGDFAAVARLFAGLSVVGLAMEFYGSSRPASGADHQIAHLWEMEGLEFNGRPVSHGACVAVGCVTTLGLFDWLLEQDLGALDPARIAAVAPTLAQKHAEIESSFTDGKIIARAKQETSAKHTTPAALEARLIRLQAIWPELKTRLGGHLMSRGQMAGLLRAAGAPVGAAEIGVSAAHLKATVRASRFIRARYTLPDLLDDTGLLDQAIAAAVARPTIVAA